MSTETITSRAPLAEITALVDQISEHAQEFQLRRHVQSTPVAEYFEVLHGLFTVVADHEQAVGFWPRSSWHFLTDVESLARALDALTRTTSAMGNYWHQCRQPDHILESLMVLPNATSTFDEDAELAPPRQVPLESVEELKEQGLTAAQVANVYGWKDRFGNLDVRRAQQALAGEIQVEPQYVQLPPEADGLPMVQPSLATVEKLAAGQAPQF